MSIDKRLNKLEELVTAKDVNHSSWINKIKVEVVDHVGKVISQYYHPQKRSR